MLLLLKFNTKILQLLILLQVYVNQFLENRYLLHVQLMAYQILQLMETILIAQKHKIYYSLFLKTHESNEFIFSFLKKVKKKLIHY